MKLQQIKTEHIQSFYAGLIKDDVIATIQADTTQPGIKRIIDKTRDRLADPGAVVCLLF